MVVDFQKLRTGSVGIILGYKVLGLAYSDHVSRVTVWVKLPERDALFCHFDTFLVFLDFAIVDVFLHDFLVSRTDSVRVISLILTSDTLTKFRVLDTEMLLLFVLFFADHGYFGLGVDEDFPLFYYSF